MGLPITSRTQEGATVSFKATVVVEKKLAPLTVEPAALNFGTVEEGYTAPSYQLPAATSLKLEGPAGRLTENCTFKLAFSPPPVISTTPPY